MNNNLHKSDRRVRRTKRVLAVVLVDLLKEKPLNRITVKEVTEIADVNRATFYRHFKDIYDMFHRIEDELLADFKKNVTVQPLRNYEDLLAFYTKIFDFVAENSDLGQLLCGPNSDQSLLEKFKVIVFDFFDNNHDSLPDIHHYTNSFIVAGFVEVIKQWLDENMPIPAQQMAEFVFTSVRYGFVPDVWAEE